VDILDALVHVSTSEPPSEEAIRVLEAYVIDRTRRRLSEAPHHHRLLETTLQHECIVALRQGGLTKAWASGKLPGTTDEARALVDAWIEGAVVTPMTAFKRRRDMEACPQDHPVAFAVLFEAIEHAARPLPPPEELVRDAVWVTFKRLTAQGSSTFEPETEEELRRYLRRAVSNNWKTLLKKRSRFLPLDEGDGSGEVRQGVYLDRLPAAQGAHLGQAPDGYLQGRELAELFQSLVDRCAEKMRGSFQQNFRDAVEQMQRIARGEVEDNNTLVEELNSREDKELNVSALQRRHFNARNRLLKGITQWHKEGRIDDVEKAALRELVERLRQRQ